MEFLQCRNCVFPGRHFEDAGLAWRQVPTSRVDLQKAKELAQDALEVDNNDIGIPSGLPWLFEDSVEGVPPFPNLGMARQAAAFDLEDISIPPLDDSFKIPGLRAATLFLSLAA